MDRNLRGALLKQIRDPDEVLLFSKLLDRVFFCVKNNRSQFSDFLDPARAAQFTEVLASGYRDAEVSACGGFEGAERLMLGFSGEGEIQSGDYPIDRIDITFDTRFAAMPAHRDLLGSIMGLGIDRAKLGDIITFESAAVVFAHKEISGYILACLETVGNKRVKSAVINDEPFSLPEATIKEETVIVSSLRLDIVIAHVFKLSRSTAAELVAAERVFVNWRVQKNAAKPVAESDMITVRGRGRVRFTEVSGRTKKDNYILKIERYG